MKAINKNQIIRTSLLGFLLFFTSQLLAADFDVEGRVLNNRKESIKNAVVTLYDVNSSREIATSVCQNDGTFCLYNVPQGEYLMTVKKNGISRAKPKLISVECNGEYVVRNYIKEENDLIAVIK